MNIIILVLVVLISIALLYLIFKRSLSESTLILQKTDLNTIDPITFDVAKIYNADSKQFTYSTWINIERTVMTSINRTIIDRPSEIKIELKKDEPTVIVSVYLDGSTTDKHTVSIEKFPLKKKVFLAVCVTDKTIKINSADTTYSVVDVYMNGKLRKSSQTKSPVTPDIVSVLTIGAANSLDYTNTTDTTGLLSPWATLYGLKRWSFCMLPKQVNDEYKSFAVSTNRFGVNIALTEKDIIKKDYALF